jgi:hypothetical protein
MQRTTAENHDALALRIAMMLQCNAQLTDRVAARSPAMERALSVLLKLKTRKLQAYMIHA